MRPPVDKGVALARGLVLGKDVRLELDAAFPGITNLSAILDGAPVPIFNPSPVRSLGGDRGRLVRMERPPGDPEMLSRCGFRASVGVNSGPVSNERNREDKSASTVSISKCGEVRYVTLRENEPIGWVTGWKLCVEVERAGESEDKGHPILTEVNNITDK